MALLERSGMKLRFGQLVSIIEFNFLSIESICDTFETNIMAPKIEDETRTEVILPS